jgi:hypothetical protein
MWGLKELWNTGPPEQDQRGAEPPPITHTIVLK